MEKLLKEAPAGKYFYVHNGMTIRNLDELAVALDLMDKKIFEYHVNQNKNDFSNWIKEIIKEEGLAKELMDIKGIYNRIYKHQIDFTNGDLPIEEKFKSNNKGVLR